MRLAAAGVTPAQVQVAWLKEALIDPGNYGAFPTHAQTLQADLETIIRNIKGHYPNIKLTYLSTRTRAYTTTFHNPEPFAYETGFAVKWAIADQINGFGDLNFDSTKGAVVAPFICWGPYFWTDGINPRSDGFTWLCSDLEADFVHPSADGGVPKVADQLLAFFKTDPTAMPWFLKKRSIGQPPSVTAAATPSSGTTNLTVQFTAKATDPDGTIASHIWTFDDGTYSYTQNPVKMFTAPGDYNAHLTVTDNDGDFVTATVPVSVSTVFTPTFSPVAGAYVLSQYPKTITIATTTPNSWLRYTTDGSTPTASHGTLVQASSGNASVPVDTTLKAIAYIGTNLSAVASGLYSAAARAATPTFTPAAGAYPSADFPKTITIATATTGCNMRYTLDGSTPTELHGTAIFGSSGTASVASGQTLKAIAFKADLSGSDSLIAFGAYSTSANQVVEPAFSPSGGTFPVLKKTVTISTTTAGAQIRWTVDGSTPTSAHGTLIASTSGSATFSIGPTVLQAVAFASGMSDSKVHSDTYDTSL